MKVKVNLRSDATTSELRINYANGYEHENVVFTALYTEGRKEEVKQFVIDDLIKRGYAKDSSEIEFC